MWESMRTAPKGGGAQMITDPEWVEPPSLLLCFDDGHIVVGSWDWYYAENGRGYKGCSAWVDHVGELLAMYYDEPIAWMLLPTHVNEQAREGNDD